MDEERDSISDDHKPDYGTDVQNKRPKLNRRMSYTVNKPKYTFIVEPLLGAVFFCLIGAFPLVEQYVYARFAEDYPILTNRSMNQSISEVCQSINSTENEIYADTQKVQSSTAQLMMYLSITAAVPSLFSTLIIGGYSDTMYRKPALILPTMGMVIRLGITVAVIVLKLPVYILYIASFMDGCFGSVGAMTMGCFSYLADIIEPGSRAFRMVILDVILALSGAASESLLGFLISRYGFTIPCLCILAVAILALLYVIFIVPEPHVPLVDAAFSLRESLTATYRVYTRQGPRRFKLWLILFALLFAQIPMVSMQSISTLFQMNHPLCWGPGLIGVYLAVALFIIQAGSFFGSMVLVKGLKLPSIVVVLIGDLSGVASNAFYAMCVETWQVFIVPVIGMFELLPLPLSRAIGSNLVDISEQGALFSGMSILYTVASVGGSVAFNSIYAVTLPFFHGTVYMISAGLHLIAFILGSVYLIHDRRSKYILLRTINPGDSPTSSVE